MKKIVFITIVLMAFTMSSFAYVELLPFTEAYVPADSLFSDVQSGTLTMRPDGNVCFELFVDNDGPYVQSWSRITLDYGYTINLTQNVTGSQSYSGMIDNNDSEISWQLGAWKNYTGINFNVYASIKIWIP